VGAQLLGYKEHTQGMLWRAAVSPRTVPSLGHLFWSRITPWVCLLSLTIDIQSIERFIIFSDIAEKEHHRVRDGISCKNIKSRNGAYCDHLVTRITTENIHFLLFQNTNRKDVGWIQGTVDINPFIRLDNGNLHGCGINGKLCGLLGRVIEKFCIPIARIAVLDHEHYRGT